jgi:3-dehydroquinate synthetase
MADLLLGFPPVRALSRVRVARGAIVRLGAFVRAVTGARRVALVTDRRVDRLWGGEARRALRRAGVATDSFLVPAGERAKRPEELSRLWDGFAAAGLSRADAVVALGGGSVGDLAGFAAATWLRGVPWVCAPTTLLAQADSSIGGKTAVDLDSGKNLVGAFHQPAGVLVDPEVLATLPARQRRAGLAEVLKKGFAVDAGLFAWCEANADELARGVPRRASCSPTNVSARAAAGPRSTSGTRSDTRSRRRWATAACFTARPSPWACAPRRN